MTDQEKLNGKVKWFNPKRGYGFITVDMDDSKKDIFVHHANMKTAKDCYKTLYSGEYITCSVSTDSSNKTQATNVTGMGGGELMCENDAVIHSREQRQTNRRRDDNSEGSNTRNDNAPRNDNATRNDGDSHDRRD